MANAGFCQSLRGDLMTLLSWIVLAQLGGTVVAAETHAPLGFTIVSLTPGGQKRFADPAGRFAFAGLQPGTYLLSARHVGYTPLDTQVVVRGDSAVTLRLALRHLAIELPPVTVAARPRCTTPGPPDPTTLALAAVFEQLQENARRFQLLSDSFPFEYRLEQTVREITSRGDTTRPIVATLRLDSRSERPYEVGRVVVPGWGPWPRDVLVIRTPSLEEFGNAAFVKHHCFYLVGRDTIEGETLVRIDFEPAANLAWSDMAGSAYLDSVTYRLRYTESSLTHPERSELAHVATMVTRTRFRDLGRGIPVQDYLRAVTTYRSGGRRRIEEQRTVDVRFRRRTPPL
jgi:hypothetical protein